MYVTMLTDEIDVAEKPKLSSILGFALIKPDAIELGIAESIIHRLISETEQYPHISLEGVDIIEGVGEEQLAKIYPELDAGYYTAYVDYFRDNRTILLTFKGTPQNTVDINQVLKNAKGKIGRGQGWQDGVRAVIPIPSTRKDFDVISEKLRTGAVLTPEDYNFLCKNLLHTPETDQEVLGLLELLDPDKAKEYLGDSYQLVFT